MPRRTRAAPIDVQARDEVGRELDGMVGALAAELGPAEGAEFPSDAKEVELWDQMDPRVDNDALKAMLKAGTVPPAWYDPHSDQRLALIRAHPEMAQMFAQPLDDEMASIVAGLAEYPSRMTVWKPYANDPEAMVRKANSVDARWRRRQGQMVGVSAAPTAGQVTEEQPAPTPLTTPAPVPPAPTSDMAWPKREIA